MKRATIVLLMQFIASVMSMLMYQSNVFPHEHLREMSEYGYKLIVEKEPHLTEHHICKTCLKSLQIIGDNKKPVKVTE